MENVINNTEPQPSTPQGANGRWEWDGNSMAKRINLSGTKWYLKGRWKWITEQVKEQNALAKQPVSVIANYGKDKVRPRHDARINKAFNNLFILCGAVIAITLILIIIN